MLVAVNAKYIHSNPAIYSLRASAGEELADYVELAEYTINQPMEEILADIYGRRPDAVGFSCYIWNWRLVRELLRELPKLLPEADLWLGGPEVSYDTDVILRQNPQLAGIMVGEGEDTFRELLTRYVEAAVPGAAKAEAAVRNAGNYGGRQKETYGSEAEAVHSGWKAASASERFREIPGLCLLTGSTPARALKDLNGIPFLYDDLEPFENRILYYETSRGCPFRCSYCLSSIEKQVRFRNIEIVKKELQFFLDHQVKQVKFVDRTFNCSHEHAMEIWSYLQEHDNGVTNFHFEISADLLREDEITLLNHFRPGLAQLEIGVQSVNARTLSAVRRTADMERLEAAVAAIRRGGNVHLHLDLIAGLPYEGYESFAHSFNQIYCMRPHQLQLGFLKVLKGTEIWEKAEEYGIRHLEQPPYEVLCTRWLSYEELRRLKRIEEMVEIYYNSGQFIHTLSFLEKAFPSPFALYEELADFCGERGCLAETPARIHRYQVLLEFAMERDVKRRNAYRELLTHDFYLRENAKSRPEFAPDLTVHKDAIRLFYQREEGERRYLPGYGAYDRKQLGKMTHMEVFSYPVWDRERMWDGYEDFGDETESARRNASFVLYDYARRDPLNHGAAVQIIAWNADGSDSRRFGPVSVRRQDCD